ncbi:MAG: DNA polymerase I, partial [candidate division Zixibacteria bacterium]|nr:DNA polymerase I [candidate division Zixibacteria bacterium]
GILSRNRPTHIAAVFDTPEPTHRHIAFPAYKAHRDAMPDDLSQQLPYLFRLFEGFSIPVVRLPGWEADDVIGTLAARAETEGFTTFMVTPDKDYGQLVSEHTVICKPEGLGDNLETAGVQAICEKWGIERVEQVVDVLGLMGDASDNIPGVPGIGEKTAQKLIAQFGSIETLLANTEALKGKQRETIEQNRDKALLSKQLVTIDRNAPVDMTLDSFRYTAKDEEKLRALFGELEFNTLGKRLFGDDFSATPQRAIGRPLQGDLFGTPEPVASSGLRTILDTPHDYRCVDTPEKRRTLIEAILREPVFCFDLETTGLDARRCDIIGLAFSHGKGSGFYVPLPDDQTMAAELLKEFSPVFSDAEKEMVGHNLKFDLSVLRWHGVAVSCRLFDTMLAAFLTAPDLRRTMDYLSEALLGYTPVSIKELIGEKGKGQGNMRDVPLEQVVEYAAEDADVTFQLSEKLRPMLDEMGQSQVFYRIECPLIPVLVEMEFEGIRMDIAQLGELSKHLDTEIQNAGARIRTLAGEAVDLNSARQLGYILFDKLKLDPNARRTAKTGQYQTTEEVLQRLAPRHEIVREILHYRMCSKLQSVYVSQLPAAVDSRTGRVHTHYEQAVIATGRIQSYNPNLQTIPIRTELGQQIRRAFVPRSDDFLMLSADYSQIELRIAAALSEDEGMIETFRHGEDIHTATAMKIYEIDKEGVTTEMRRQAKTVNFGIIYGISAFGLAERLNISRTQGQELIDQYFAKYPGTRRYMDETVAFAREHGYVETLTGRRRYLKAIDARNAVERKAEERNAINSRIQGTAADLIKLAMSRIHRELCDRDAKTRMLLQVHDELVFDLHQSETVFLPEVIAEIMRTALPMTVPIEVEVGIGKNWLEAH